MQVLKDGQGKTWRILQTGELVGPSTMAVPKRCVLDGTWSGRVFDTSVRGHKVAIDDGNYYVSPLDLLNLSPADLETLRDQCNEQLERLKHEQANT